MPSKAPKAPVKQSDVALAIEQGALLDAVIEKLGLKNDAELARLAKLSKPVISRIRSGGVPLAAGAFLRIHALTGIPTAELRSFLSPAHSLNRVMPEPAPHIDPLQPSSFATRNYQTSQHRGVMQKHTASPVRNPHLLSQGLLLDAVIRAMHLKNDAALARATQLSPATVNKLRTTTIMGPSTLLRLHEVSNLEIHTLKSYLPGEHPLVKSSATNAKWRHAQSQHCRE